MFIHKNLYTQGYSIINMWSPKVDTPKCLSIGEEINKMWHTFDTVEYYSAIKRNEVLIHATTRMNLENRMLSERSQTQKPFRQGLGAGDTSGQSNAAAPAFTDSHPGRPAARQRKRRVVWSNSQRAPFGRAARTTVPSALHLMRRVAASNGPFWGPQSLPLSKSSNF